MKLDRTEARQPAIKLNRCLIRHNIPTYRRTMVSISHQDRQTFSKILCEKKQHYFFSSSCREEYEEKSKYTSPMWRQDKKQKKIFQTHISDFPKVLANIVAPIKLVASIKTIVLITAIFHNSSLLAMTVVEV